MSTGLGGLGLVSGGLAVRLTAWQPWLVPVSAAFLALAYYHAYHGRAASRRQRVWVWITTPLTVFFWILPYLGR